MTRALAIVSLFFAAACGPTVDLAKAVAPESVTTGWADGGGVAGKRARSAGPCRRLFAGRAIVGSRL